MLILTKNDEYVSVYHGHQVQAIHRSMADMASLSEALASVGFRCIGLPWSTGVNPKLETDRVDKGRPRIQVVDYVYVQNPDSASQILLTQVLLLSGV